MIVNLPQDLDKLNLSHNHIIKMNGSTIVYINRIPEIKKAKINLTQHLIVFGVKGQKKFMAPEVNILLAENEAVFLKKGGFVSTEKVPQNAQYESVLFFLEDLFLADFHHKNESHFNLLDKKNKDIYSYFKFEATPSLTGYIHSLLPYFKNANRLHNPLFQLKIEELLLGFLINDKTNGFNDFLMQLNHLRRYSLEDIMLQNFDSNLSVEEFAFLSGMSVSTFKRNFQNQFSTSPAKWIRERRLQKAASLLQDSEKNVNEVALEVGFENTSHFIQKFQMAYGVTPKRYRKSLL